jgi:hypothetical protein
VGEALTAAAIPQGACPLEPPEGPARRRAQRGRRGNGGPPLDLDFVEAYWRRSVNDRRAVLPREHLLEIIDRLRALELEATPAYSWVLDGERRWAPRLEAEGTMDLARGAGTQRLGDWMQTYTGLQFWPLDPRPGEVRAEDVARALSMQCRFNGHSEAFYSVAQHSVHVSRLVPPEDALWGLMHDAAEAYVGDMIRPIKTPEFRAMEDGVLRAVASRFGLPWPAPPSVREADGAALATEARDLMKAPPAPWEPLPPPDPRPILALGPREAELEFLGRLRHLAGG